MRLNGSPYGAVACALLVFSTLQACRKGDQPPRWDVDVTGPLIRSTFTISDLVPDSMLQVGVDGAITLVYHDELFGVDLDTLIDVPDTSIIYDYTIPFTITLGAGASLPGNNETTTLDVDELQLRYLELREGQLQLTLFNSLASGVYATFGLPGASYLGSPVNTSQFVGPGTISSPASAVVVRDLSWHQFDLTGPTFDQVNTLATELELQLDPAGSGATMTPADTVRAMATYSGLKPQYARGYFGQRTVHVGPEVSNFGLFDPIIAGSVDLDQVTLRLKVTNGIGIDARVEIDHLTATNTSSGVSLDLSHSIITGPINLNRAIDLGGSFQPSVYENDLDNSDSNLDLMLEAMPDQMEFEMDLEVNPLGDISNGNDFLYWNSILSAEVELEVPLNLIATGITLQQTQSPDLPGSSEGHAPQFGELKLFATNGFPLDAVLTLDIVDAAGNVLVNLPVNGTIASGILGADLHVQTPVNSVLTSYVNAEELDLLYAGGLIRSTLVFNTTDQTQHLQILDSYKLDLLITVDGNYVINGDE